MRLSLPTVHEDQQKFSDNGVIIYRGPSRFDGKPIVVVVTGLATRSVNGKTGGVVQVWILRDDGRHTTDAIKDGEDYSVCGNCVHRKAGGANSCYTYGTMGGWAVSDGVIRGIYRQVTPAEAARLVAGTMVRLGAYGDPAAVPAWVVHALLEHAADWLGYTHQWRQPRFEWVKRYCMASCDTQAHYGEARDAGWRTFTGLFPGEELQPGQFLCPASKEAGNRLTCEECGACNGGSPPKASPAIYWHGGKSLPAKLANLQALLGGCGS